MGKKTGPVGLTKSKKKCRAYPMFTQIIYNRRYSLVIFADKSVNCIYGLIFS